MTAFEVTGVLKLSAIWLHALGDSEEEITRTPPLLSFDDEVRVKCAGTVFPAGTSMSMAYLQPAYGYRLPAVSVSWLFDPPLPFALAAFEVIAAEQSWMYFSVGTLVPRSVNDANVTVAFPV